MLEFKPRTQQEIAEFFLERKKRLMNLSLLEVDYLTWETAQEYLKDLLIDGAKEDDWITLEYTKEKIIERMRDYADFAVMKWEDDRELSIMRANQHYEAWLWLLGDDYYNHYWKDGDIELPDFYYQFNDIK
jgi:hypothetical protein